MNKALIQGSRALDTWTVTKGQVSGLGNTFGNVIQIGNGSKPKACTLFRKCVKYFVLTFRLWLSEW